MVNKALFPGGGGIGGVPLDSHDLLVKLYTNKCSLPSRANPRAGFFASFCSGACLSLRGENRASSDCHFHIQDGCTCTHG